MLSASSVKGLQSTALVFIDLGSKTELQAAVVAMCLSDQAKSVSKCGGLVLQFDKQADMLNTHSKQSCVFRVKRSCARLR